MCKNAINAMSCCYAGRHSTICCRPICAVAPWLRNSTCRASWPLLSALFEQRAGGPDFSPYSSCWQMSWTLHSFPPGECIALIATGFGCMAAHRTIPAL